MKKYKHFAEQFSYFRLCIDEQGAAKRLTAILLGVGVSAAILGYFAISLNWVEFGEQLSKINLLYIPLLFLLLLITFVIRALRWKYLLPSNVELSSLRLFEATVVGFLATFVLPLRAGEFVRPWVLSRWQPVTFSSGFASIVTERVFDVLALMFMLGLCLLKIDEAPTLVIAGANALGILALAILAIMIYSYFFSERLLKFISRVIAALVGKNKPELADKLMVMIQDFVHGLKAISSFKELALVIIWSLVLWLTMAALYQVGLWAFGSFPSLWVGLTISVMIALAVAAPSAPGFLGTFQLGCVLALAMYGFSQEYAIAYSLLVHSFQIIAIVLMGSLIMSYRGLAFSELCRRSQD